MVDLNLPGVSGIAGIQALKDKAGPRAEFATGICTGSIDPAEKQTARDIGADFFVHKPFDAGALGRICKAVGFLSLEPAGPDGGWILIRR